MARRIEHYSGEVLNAIGSIFLRDVPTPEGQKGRFALIECGECHKPHIQKLCNVINGNSACAECGQKKNQEYIKNNIARHYSYGDVLNEETGTIFIKEVSHEGFARRRAEVKCGRCGHTYIATISNVVNGSYCYHCSDCRNSNASKKVERIFIDNGIPYEREYTFSDLRGFNSSYLRYDFAVFLKSNNILLIEIDGRQHFEPVEYWGGLEYFNRLRENDKKKTLYAQEHSFLRLIRIPHTDFNKINKDYILDLLQEYDRA